MRSIGCAVSGLLLFGGIFGCQEVAGECWPVSEDGQGAGVGGGPLLPGAGGYGNVPPEPQGLGDAPPPECNRVPDTACNEKCLTDYENAAADCTKIADETQKKTCDDKAYTRYSSCRDNCQKSLDCRKDCEDKAEACEAECRKLPEDDKAARQKCWKACNNAYAECIKKCKD